MGARFKADWGHKVVRMARKKSFGFWRANQPNNFEDTGWDPSVQWTMWHGLPYETVDMPGSYPLYQTNGQGQPMISTKLDTGHLGLDTMKAWATLLMGITGNPDHDTQRLLRQTHHEPCGI
jgi:hypothetical protein